MTIQLDESFTTELLQNLVRINSVNPGLSPDGPGETEIAAYLVDVLSGIGLHVERHEPEAGRPSVVGVLKGTGGGRSLMLNAHMDTVGVEGMADPFSADIRDGRLFGRGAYDMKGSLAACVGALKALLKSGTRLSGDVMVAGVADEEVASIGTIDLVEKYQVDAAVVTEPSALDVCVAHKGFVWIEVRTFGRAAHGSKPELGRDANVMMGRVLTELRELDLRLAREKAHELVGRPSVHAGTIRGGTGPSTYAAECRVVLERRTIPGETAAEVESEISEVLERLTADDPEFRAEMRTELVREPFEARSDSEIVEIVKESARRVRGEEPRVIGETPWMDSALLAAAGVDTVVMGVDGGGAHSDEEWVELDSVMDLARLLADAAATYSG